MADSSYGILLPSYWDGPTGRRFQAYGKDAVILGTFLMANPNANMIGLYELSFAKLLRSLPVLKSRMAIKKVIAFVAKEGFAFYDFGSEYVWVREMARVRLNLNGTPMPLNDKRRLGAVRLYEALPPNPHLGPFFERYGVELQLPRRRGTPRGTQGASEGASEGPSEGVSQGACLTPSITSVDQDQVPGTRDQVPEIRYQRSGKRLSAGAQTPRPTPPSPATTTNPDDNLEVITALVLKEILDLPEAEWAEATKERCARLRIAYNASVVRRAIESAQFRRHLETPMFESERR